MAESIIPNTLNEQLAYSIETLATGISLQRFGMLRVLNVSGAKSPTNDGLICSIPSSDRPHDTTVGMSLMTQSNNYFSSRITILTNGNTDGAYYVPGTQTSTNINGTQAITGIVVWLV